VERVCKILGVDPEAPRGPGNEQVMEWFRTYLRKVGAAKRRVRKPLIYGRVDISHDRTNSVDLEADDRDNQFSDLKKRLRSRREAFVYHSYKDAHYCLVSGYFESAVKPDAAFEDRPLLHRWIILGDHYAGNKPVRCLRWRDILEDFADHSYSCFLHFSKTHGPAE
jgi:hypothetical protein